MQQLGTSSAAPAPSSGHTSAEATLAVIPQPVQARGKRWALAGLLLLLVLVGLVRWRFLDTPLERDEGEFAYGAQRLLAGEIPYVSFHAMKLPGIYVAYAVIERLFGETARRIHMGLLLVNLTSIVLVYALGNRLCDSKTGVISALAFALLALSPAVLGTQAQAEHFVILPALAGLVLLLYAEKRPGLLFAAGLLLGLAPIVKQHGAMFGIGAIGYYVWSRDWKGLTALSLGYVLPLIATCLTFSLLGAWRPFVFWTWTYPQAYASQFSAPLAWHFFTHSLAAQAAHCLEAVSKLGN